MPLEDLVGPNKYLDALNRNWPLDADTASEGNDHISGHKNVVLNTFPGPNGNGLEEAVHVERSALFVDNGNGEDRQGALEMAVGSTAQRPADADLLMGDTRWNVTTNRLETWAGSAWIELHAMAALTSMFRTKQNFEADAAALAHVSSDEAVAFTRQLGTILDATGGSEEGALIFEAITSGALAEALRVIGAGASSPLWHIRRSGNDVPQEGEDILGEFTVEATDSHFEATWDNANEYREVEVIFDDFHPAAAQTLWAQFRATTWLTGNSYRFGASGYYHNSTGAAAAGYNIGQIILGADNNACSAAAAAPQCVRFRFPYPHLAGTQRHATYEASLTYFNDVGAFTPGSAYYAANGAVDGVRLFWSGGSLFQAGGVARAIGRK